MDSPLEVIDGRFTSAVLTTFTIDLGFFDQWVLPRLHGAGVRNIVLLCDSQQLADYLVVGESRRAGQHYHVAAVDSAGVFHPKVIYLSGPDEQRACVSSANLTAAGQLRNLETAAVLSSQEPGHLAALDQVRQFVRALADDQPVHVVEAALDALEHGDLGAAGGGGPRFLHNLTTPIVDQLPGAASFATAPFASGAAIETLGRDSNRVVVYLDERRRETIDQTRRIGPSLQAVRFLDDDGGMLDRVAHGKAIWSDEGWCLVGSPNLTEAALARTRANGNVEAAVLFPDSGFELPPHEVVATPPPLGTASASGSAAVVDESTIFRAVFEGELRVEGLPDGVMVEGATALGWVELGVVASGVIEFIDGADPIPPTRLRATLPGGIFAYALVHYPPYLRARRRTPPSRSSEAVTSPPLDVQGIGELEAVLGDLYALDGLVAEEIERLAAEGKIPAAQVNNDIPIDSWKPARPDDDPRIPDLYRQVFSGDPDALLALVRNALRLDAPDQLEVAIEDNEELENEEAAESESNDREKRAPLTEAAVLRRYRGSLLDLLDRGASRVKEAKVQSLRDLTFLEVLRFHERLTQSIVRIPKDEAAALGVVAKADDEGHVEVPLVEPSQLVHARWRMLGAYLASDPTLEGDCASVLLSHLAAAIEDREKLDDVSARRLDTATYEVAPRLLQVADLDIAADGLLGPHRCAALLEPYAQRTDWYAIVDECEIEGWITEGDLVLDPHPVVSGVAEFRRTFDSPAWQILGYSCIAGYEDTEPFAAVVRNGDLSAPFSMHCLLIEPTGRPVHGDRIHQALFRRADGRWLCRTFEGFHKTSADRLLNTVGVQRVMHDLGGPDEIDSQDAPAWLRPLLARSSM